MRRGHLPVTTSAHTATEVLFVEQVTASAKRASVALISALDAPQKAPFLHIFLEPFRCPRGPPQPPSCGAGSWWQYPDAALPLPTGGGNSSLLRAHGRRYSRLPAGNFFGTIAPSVLSSLPPSLNTAYRPNGAAPESAVTRHRRSAWIPGRPLRASPR